MTAPTRDKADRLLREKRVHYQGTIPDGSLVYWVDGDSGRTRVVTLTTSGETTCDCPAMIPDCAHVLAVLDLAPPVARALLSPDDPIETIPIPDDENRDHVEEAHNVAILDDESDDFTLEPVGDVGPVPMVDSGERRDLIDLSTAPVTWRTLETISRTEFVPAALRGKPAACLAAILTGRELGIGPMTSLRQIAVIDGSPTLSAELMLKLYRQAGHRLDVTEATDRVVEIVGTRGDTGETMTIHYDLEDAIGSGLVQVDENGEPRARSQRGNPLPWERYTADLLWARAVTRLVRRLAPDLAATEAMP